MFSANNEFYNAVCELERAFYDGYFRFSSCEFIAHTKGNVFISLADCQDRDDVRALVLEWMSRDAYKGAPYSQEWRNKQFRRLLRAEINSYLGQAFTEKDMEIIYQKLGNAINHDLTMRFIKNGMNVYLLETDNY